MSISPRRAGSTRASRSCSSGPDRLSLLLGWRGPPAHPVEGRAGNRVHIGSRDDESLFLVKPDGARIVLVDQQIEAVRRASLGVSDKGGGERGTPFLGGDNDLVEIACRPLDGDEAQNVAAFAGALGYRDCGNRHQLAAPALGPPGKPGGKVELRIGGLPSAPPQVDRRCLVGRGIGAELETSAAHRSVSFSSMRRLRRKASSPLSVSSGWNSPKPAATRCWGEMPFWMRYCTTEMARADESAQFEGNCVLAIGRTSVCPSTRNTQAISVGICFSRSLRAAASVSISLRPSGFSTAWPTSKKISDWNTNRSPTMRTSGRLPRISRSRPKKSERKRDSS